MIDVKKQLEKRDKMINLLDETVNAMECLMRSAVDDKGEERAFTANEQNEFDELQKVGNILKKIVMKYDLSPKDYQTLMRTAFIGTGGK